MWWGKSSPHFSFFQIIKHMSSDGWIKILVAVFQLSDQRGTLKALGKRALWSQLLWTPGWGSKAQQTAAEGCTGLWISLIWGRRVRGRWQQAVGQAVRPGTRLGLGGGLLVLRRSLKYADGEHEASFLSFQLCWFLPQNMMKLFYWGSLTVGKGRVSWNCGGVGGKVLSEMVSTDGIFGHGCKWISHLEPVLQSREWSCVGQLEPGRSWEGSKADSILGKIGD